MCRYGYHDYKEHFACFDCRKAFKRHESIVVWTKPQAQGSKWSSRLISCGLARCPECRRPMVAMGLDFEVPRQSDFKQWRKVEILARHNIRYSSCGCNGPGPRPRTLAEVGPFLVAQPARSPGEALLRSIDRKRP
jgi:hypothetical protein